MLSINKVVHAKDTFCYRDYVCQVSKLQYISCYTLLHQATMDEGKNSLRERRDILVSDRDQQRFFFIILP